MIIKFGIKFIISWIFYNYYVQPLKRNIHTYLYIYIYYNVLIIMLYYNVVIGYETK